jgi:hypothetical protein
MEEFEITRRCRISDRTMAAQSSWALGNSSQQQKGQARSLCMCVRQHPLNLSNHKASKCHYLNPVVLQLDQVGLMAAPTLDHEPALPRIRYHTSRVMATTPSSPCLSLSDGYDKRYAPKDDANKMSSSKQCSITQMAVQTELIIDRVNNTLPHKWQYKQS